MTINHIGGGLVVGDKEQWVKLKAWPRIGVLVNHLRPVPSVTELNSFVDEHAGVSWMHNCSVALKMGGP